jgi:hypothetical protein
MIKEGKYLCNFGDWSFASHPDLHNGELPHAPSINPEAKKHM